LDDVVRRGRDIGASLGERELERLATIAVRLILVGREHEAE
jgi:hypothetical protein